MPAAPTTVSLIGDATAAGKAPGERPETGWGTPFADRLDDSVTVATHARDDR